MTALKALLVLMMFVSDKNVVTHKYDIPVLYQLMSPSQFQVTQTPHSVSDEKEGKM